MGSDLKLNRFMIGIRSKSVLKSWKDRVPPVQLFNLLPVLYAATIGRWVTHLIMGLRSLGTSQQLGLFQVGEIHSPLMDNIGLVPCTPSEIQLAKENTRWFKTNGQT
jgi:hypothetical protein